MGRTAIGSTLLVGLDEFAPGVVAVEPELVGELPGQVGVLEGCQGEEHRVVGLSGQGCHDLVCDVGPCLPGGGVEAGRGAGGWPAPEHPQAGRE